MYEGNAQEIAIGKIVFWPLIFAHFAADYPLQSKYMVENKTRLGVLVLHVFIHFLVAVSFVLVIVPRAWPYALLLAFFHFGIDVGKKSLNAVRPNWVIVPYFVDQFIHIISILLIAYMIWRNFGILPFQVKPLWLIISTAFLIVTYVWFITEKTLAYNNPGYFKQVINQEWTRMASRAFLLGLFLISIMSLSSSKLLSAGFLQFPYSKKNNGLRAFITDLAVSLIGAVIIVLIL